MALGWFNTKVNPIAVDVGTSCIKMLQVEPRDGGLKLLAAACTDIPHDLRGKPRERDEFAADAIKKMLGEAGFKGRQVATCLPAAHVAMQHLRVARMSDEELAKALPFEAAGKLPFDSSRAVIRHLVAGEVYHDQEAKMEVILMAASRESVERHLAMLSRAKTEVVGIHVEPNALIECFSHLFRRKGDENLSTMFIDIGAGSTHVVISHGKQIVFAKHLAFGGDLFNRKAGEALKIAPGKASETRVAMMRQATTDLLPAGVVSIGANGVNAHPLGAANNRSDALLVAPEAVKKVSDALEEPVGTLISELELCVRYYESVFGGKPVDRTLFLGGEARHVTLCQKIAQRLALPATLGDPLARLAKDNGQKCGVDLKSPQPGWAIAVGLAQGIRAEAEQKTKVGEVAAV